MPLEADGIQLDASIDDLLYELLLQVVIPPAGIRLADRDVVIDIGFHAWGDFFELVKDLFIDLPAGRVPCFSLKGHLKAPVGRDLVQDIPFRDVSLNARIGVDLFDMVKNAALQVLHIARIGLHVVG